MTLTWNDDSPVQRHPRAVWRAFEGEVAIIAPWEGAVRTLNHVGARCWELADGRSFRAIVDVLLGEFDVSRSVLEGDLRAFLAELAARELLALGEDRP
ncbi:MAG: PqqD family protein [Candidatus Eisenbacteria bacterium]|nr:PqqD family protein [Candidatus Eisenbacteria bacterium]